MLLLPQQGTQHVHSYVGRTKAPLRRLRDHLRRPQAKGIAAALKREHCTTAELLYVPLQIVHHSVGDFWERTWTLRSLPSGKRSMNGYRSFGNPACSKQLWRRRSKAQLMHGKHSLRSDNR